MTWPIGSRGGDLEQGAGRPLPLRGEDRALERDLRQRFDVIEVKVAAGLTTVRLLRPARADALIREEDFVRDERLPYWADLWPSSLAMSAHLRGLEGSGRTLLELGCGLGLVSTAAASAGFAVTATDYYDDALLFTTLNVVRNTGRRPRTRLVDWRELPPELGRFDRVVASDVLYERDYAPLVASVFARTLAPDGEGWIADPGRVAADAFVAHCPTIGLLAERYLVVPYEEAQIRQRITLYRVRWTGD